MENNMENNRNRLESKVKNPLIEGASRGKAYFYKGRAVRRIRFGRWYVAYLVTTMSVVVAVLLLLFFGVGESGKPLGENFKFSAFAERVVGWLINEDGTGHPDSSESTDSSVNDDLSSPSTSPKPEDTDDQKVGVTVNGLYDFDYSKVPDGHTPIIPMDLSLSKYGDTYINNATGYTPNTAELIEKQLGGDHQPLSSKNGPVVLIIHTHGTEAYSENGAISFPADAQNYARTSDTEKNVVAVGKALADELIKNGIPTAHCTVLHDSIQYKDSYSRAEETIKKYLVEYPTIKLVIDVHRDSIVKSSGEVVRPVAERREEAAAQVMCVVGSSWAGEECPNWENNLSLALKLRKELNSECENICRPVYLKGNTYNQEIAPYSLLLEVGSQGNSLEEAVISAKLTGEKLALLINEI